MKKMRKFVSVLLTMVMALAVAVPSFAAEISTKKQIDLSRNAITVGNPIAGATYNIYKMLDLEVNADKTSYSYTIADGWKNFFTGDGAGTAYFDVDAKGYVTLKDGKNTAGDMEKLGKLAAAYAEQNKIETTKKPITAKGFDAGILFGDLDSGYYLITSTAGTKAIVLTTPDNREVTITEKNEKPTVEKKVKEDSTGTWGDENDAQIGDTVEYQTTIKAMTGAKNYVLHDTMTKGLTLNQDSIKVTVGDTFLTKDTDYTVAFDTSDGCAFEITFKQSYLDTITQTTEIVVTYTAVLNEKTEISTDVNTNKTKLDYGTNSSTKWDKTDTKTFEFDIVKTDSDDKVLEGAEFVLYDTKTGGNIIPLVKVKDGVYRVATEAEKKSEGFESAVIKAGQATIQGLDGDSETTYWLEETKAPAGYKILSERVKVSLNGVNLSATVEYGEWQEGGIQVINRTGSELPSTGGIGTTIFYVAGGIMVVGAAVLLVTKRRMKTED